MTASVARLPSYRSYTSSLCPKEQNSREEHEKAQPCTTEYARRNQFASPPAFPPSPNSSGRGTNNYWQDAKQQNKALPEPVVIHHMAELPDSIT